MLTKAALRAQLSLSRRERPVAERATARDAISRHVLARWPSCPVICGYDPLPTEPGSQALLDALAASGATVLVPVTLPSRDLSWTRWRGNGDGLGVDAVSGASLVLVPALAVAPDGTRLGRGGGSYDRALPRRAPGTPAVALLFDGELLPDVPADPWDVPVDAAVTPAGYTVLGIPGSGPPVGTRTM